MTGRIVQVATSRGGVPKLPLLEGHLEERGFVGDKFRNPRFHGGPQQAVLLITLEGIEELKVQGFPLFPGALGENLTTKGLDRRTLRIGDKLRAGEASIQITKLRVPCDTLTPYGAGIQAAVFDARVKAGDSSSPRWGLGGFYAKVLEAGVIRPNDIITLDRAVPPPDASPA